MLSAEGDIPLMTCASHSQRLHSLMALLLTLLVAAVNASAKPPAPTLHRVFNPYWEAGYGWTSILELHNTQVNQPLDVTENAWKSGLKSYS